MKGDVQSIFDLGRLLLRAPGWIWPSFPRCLFLDEHGAVRAGIRRKPPEQEGPEWIEAVPDVREPSTLGQARSLAKAAHGELFHTKYIKQEKRWLAVAYVDLGLPIEVAVGHGYSEEDALIDSLYTDPLIAIPPPPQPGDNRAESP